MKKLTGFFRRKKTEPSGATEEALENKSVNESVNEPVATLNSYCRTSAFTHEAIKKLGHAVYYEAIRSAENQWYAFRVEHLPNAENNGVSIRKTKINVAPLSFAEVLKKFYALETGEETLGMKSIEGRDSLGLDHFHVLAHAEGYGFKKDGNLTRLVNGRAIEEGEYSLEEVESARKDWENPTPPKKLKRPALSDIFAETNRPSLVVQNGLYETFDQKEKLENTIRFFKESLEYFSEEVEKEASSCWWALKEGKELKYTDGPWCWTVYGRAEYKVDFFCLEEDLYKKNDKFLGKIMLLPEIIKREAKKEGLVLPEAFDFLAEELKLFQYYIVAKWAYQSSNKKALDFCYEGLKTAYSEMKGEKPAWQAIEDGIVSDREEKTPQAINQMEQMLKDLKQQAEDALQELHNRVQNRALPVDVKPVARPAP